MEPSPDELTFMRRAVAAGKRSSAEPGKVTPKVGVVVVRGSEILGESFRGETGTGDHAEYGLLKQLEGVSLSGATVFTTLEPCSRRSPEKQPCAERLIAREVGTVIIGMYDPNSEIYREGWRMLRDAGVELRDFDTDLRKEIQKDNLAFMELFQLAIGDEGTATFDYLQNGGRFEIFAEETRLVGFQTKWTRGGRGAIYAYDSDNLVALARYANAFEEIDDPGALDFSNYSLLVREGEIAVFRNGSGFALVQVVRVLAGPQHGDDRTEAQIRYQLRLSD